jgi:excisionase family DNA binding protein
VADPNLDPEPSVAKSKSGEFYTFDEVLRQLNIDENRLKRLVSEGEIRAFREGDQMKFKRTEIDNLAGKSGRGSSSDTSLSEISLEDEPASRKKGLGDDLLDEPDLTKRGGMKTAEISSQDTFIDKGGDVGMSTEPIDFTEEVAGEEAEEMSADVSAKPRRTAAAAPARKPSVVVVEPKTHPGLVLALVVTTLISLYGALVVISVARGGSNGNEIARKAAEIFASDIKIPGGPAPAAPAAPGR